MAKRRKLTNYQKMQKAVSTRCKNPTPANCTRAAEAKQRYINDAISKGKTKAEALRIANNADSCNPFSKRRGKR